MPDNNLNTRLSKLITFIRFSLSDNDCSDSFKEALSLIEEGANIDLDDTDFNILKLAILKGSKSTIKKLIGMEADVGFKKLNDISLSDKGETALHYAVGINSFDTASLLIDGGVDINIKDNYLDTPLIVACYNRKTAAVEFLLERGAELHNVNNIGESAITIPRIMCDSKTRERIDSHMANLETSSSDKREDEVGSAFGQKEYSTFGRGR